MQTYSLFRVGRTWHYRFRLDGRRVQRSTHETDRREADRIAADAWGAALKRSRGEEPEPTLAGLAEAWIQAHALSYSPSRIRSVDAWRRCHVPTLLNLPLRQIDTRRVEEARDLYLEHHKRTSANQWLAILRALFNWARRRRMVRERPWEVGKLKEKRVHKPTLPMDVAPEWVRTAQELSESEPGIGLVLRILVGMGLRVSEAIGARWEWLDFERNEYIPGDTKDGKAIPRPVDPLLMADLQARAGVQDGHPTGYIVPMRPGHPITERRVAYLMGKANAACRTLHLTPHRLRATYATVLSASGVPIQDIQRALGHADPRTTMRYLVPSNERIAKAQISFVQHLWGLGEKVANPDPQMPVKSNFVNSCIESTKPGSEGAK